MASVKLKAGDYFYSAKIYFSGDTTDHHYRSGIISLDPETTFSDVLDSVLHYSCSNSGLDLERENIHMLAFNQVNLGAE